MIRVFSAKQNPSKRSDCCSKTDVAHDPTHVTVSSCFGLILAPKIVVFSLKIDEQNVSKSRLLFFRDLFLQHAPKFDEKETQNALSDLGKVTLRAYWLLRGWLLVPKTPSKGLQLLTGTSLGGSLDLIWKLTESISISFEEHTRLSNQAFPVRFPKLAVDIL